jgi:glycine dehydrogenase subunit 1
VRYIPHTPEDIEQMLAQVGAHSLDDLFASVAVKHRLQRPLDLPEAASEQEVLAEMAEMAGRNASAHTHDWFLGAGTYPHFIPSAVDAIVSRSEFYTAYTPYQAEISQGTLQTIFEWQTMICALTGLDVANASLYDGASATAEAVLMAMRITKRSRVVVARGLHPHYRDVVRTYLDGLGAEIVELGRDEDGRTAAPEAILDDDTACLVLQQPSFLGAIEESDRFAEAAHARGALLVTVTCEALALALLRAPGDRGADLVCGEAQSFGVPMSIGGPHLGFLAARKRHVRQIPGRLVGQTVDTEGRRGFVLTLATREQHIRRERATSNICTNQGLCLLIATVYLALLGRRGLRRLAEINLAKAQYARSRVLETPGLTLPIAAPSFNEFCIGVAGGAAPALRRAFDAGIVGGLDLADTEPELGPAVLVCTTECASRDAIDRLIAALAGSGA